MKHSRRNFMRAGAASLVVGSAMLESAMAFGKSLGLPLGLQLYSVRDLLPKDFDGTLKQLGNLGIREVESAGYYKHSAAEVKKALDAAGLKLVSAHVGFDMLLTKLDEAIAFHHELGAQYIVCPVPAKTPANVKKGGHWEDFAMDDWKYSAEQFNAIGEKVHAAGLKFGYHNHKIEFKKADGVTPYDELVRLTDPAKVTFELDLGWVVVGGGDPVALLKKYSDRISMLHVKDFKVGVPSGKEPDTIEELGRGTIDYAPIFAAAASTGNIKHVFVEQEAFNVPPMESLKIDVDYMKKMGAAV
jgi:sugar phosphate isomerase/epimerase